MGSGGPLPSGQRRWLTLYYARHTWAEFDAQDLPAAMTNDPDAFPSKPRRRAGGSDNGHHETRPQRRRRLGGDAATPSSQNELRPPPTRKAQPQASVGPPAPPKRRLPLAEASFAEPESRPIRDQASRGSRRTAGENRGRRVALAALISAALVGSGFFLLPVRDSGGVAPEPQRDADVAPTEDNESAQVPASTQVPAPTATEPALTPTSAPTSPPSSAPTSSLLPTTTLGEPSDDDFAPLLSELAALIGEPASTRPRYDRESFNEGADLDGDCIRTRHEVLIEEATDPVTMSVSGCSVAVGDWYDPFTGRSTADPRDLQVDHVVSLSDAWHSGAWAWSPGQKTEFSNDLSNLNAIWGSENQRKSNLGPSQYVPLNESQTCAYLVQYAEVKVAWRLSITTADYEATAAGLGNCGSSDVGQRPAPASTGLGLPAATTTSLARLEDTVSTSGSSQGCHPAYEPCIPNLEGDSLNCGDLGADQKPVRVIEPAVDPFRLDGDNDGVGCEGG